MSLTHPETIPCPPPTMEQLSSTKLVPGGEKKKSTVGERYSTTKSPVFLLSPFHWAV